MLRKDAVGHLSNVRISYHPIFVMGKLIINHIARICLDKFWVETLCNST